MKQIMIREAQVEDATTIAEVVCLLAAGLFIFDNIRKKRKAREGKEE